MEPEQFDENAPGKLYDDEGYFAYRPDGLPPDFELSTELALKLAEASQAVGNLSGIGHTVENPWMLIRPFVRKEAVQSSQIEGTKATLSDLYVHEAGQEKILSQQQRNEVIEVANYVSAMERGIESLRDTEITLDLIKKLHYILLTGVRGEDKAPGQFILTAINT